MVNPLQHVGYDVGVFERVDELLLQLLGQHVNKVLCPDVQGPRPFATSTNRGQLKEASYSSEGSANCLGAALRGLSVDAALVAGSGLGIA